MNYDYKETENIVQIEISNKKEYYQDLMNIEQSWTGRLDAKIVNTFMLESVQLIINSIVLFEKGYFDCSFYSLRQSLELSTTMVYLTELESDRKDEVLNNWKGQSDFPMFAEMIKVLQENKFEFSDMLTQMSDFFNNIKDIKFRLNKFVHKQGFRTFYVSRNHLVNRHKDKTNFVNEFNEFVKACIGSVAVLRLAIDPFPILLMDEEIYIRTFDLLTEPYSQNFVEKYIGFKAIEDYKKTSIFKIHYKGIMAEEAKLPSVVDIVKDQYIDNSKRKEIFSQKHLLSKVDILAVLISIQSDKIAKIYFGAMFLYYHTTTNSKRVNQGYDSRDINRIKESNSQLNNIYDESFLSYIFICDEGFVIEHNEILSESEITELKNISINKL